jgi:hypothetical protein
MINNTISSDIQKSKIFLKGCIKVLFETCPIALFGVVLALLRAGFFATNKSFFGHSYKLAAENYIPVTVTTFSVCTCAVFFLIPFTIGLFGYSSLLARFSRNIFDASSKFTISAMWLSIGILFIDQISRLTIRNYIPVESILIPKGPGSDAGLLNIILIPMPLIPLTHVVQRLKQEMWGFTKKQALASTLGFALWCSVAYYAIFL